jgi:primosomal protein N'
MATYCEVALPVPLDRTFTYALCIGQKVQRGMRVIAPFRNEKLIGVVSAVDVKAPPDVEIRALEAVLDDEPLLSEQLLSLAEWMAQYYLAPLGEVLRGMLPLTAEVRRTVYYRITDLGRDVLAGAIDGESPAGHRTRAVRVRAQRQGSLSGEEQNLEFRVLEKLADGEAVKVSTLRTATAASLPVLAALLRRKWIARETAAVERPRPPPPTRGAWSALQCSSARRVCPNSPRISRRFWPRLRRAAAKSRWPNYASASCLRLRCKPWCAVVWCASRSARRSSAWVASSPETSTSR